MFKVSPKKMRKFAERINAEIFNNVLDIDELVFRNKKTEKENARAWFYYDSNIGFSSIILIEAEHHSEYEVFHSLCHELIHYWQDSIAEMNKLPHNSVTFRYWKRIMCDTYGFDFHKRF